MINRLRKLMLSATVKDTSVLFVGSITSSIFAIIFTVLFGRYLGPENLAIGTAVVGFVAILNAVGDLGLGSSLFRYVSKHWKTKNYKKANSILQGIFNIRIKTALFVFALLALLSPIISPKIFKYDSPLLALYAGIAVAGYLIFEFQTQVFQAKGDFRKASILLGSNNAFRLALLIILHYLGLLTLLSAIFIFAVTSFVIYVFSLKWNYTRVTRGSDWRKHTKKIGVFSGWMGMNRIFSAISGRIDTILLLQFIAAYEVGIYAAARQLSFGVPIVIGSFATVLAPRFASLKGEKLKNYLAKSVGLSTFISLGLAFGIAISPFVISFFGDKYTDSVRVLQFLLAGYIPFVLATPAVNLVIYAYGKPKILTITSMIQMPFVVLGIIMLAPRMGIYAPVMMNLLINLSTFVIAYMFAFKYMNTDT